MALVRLEQIISINYFNHDKHILTLLIMLKNHLFLIKNT